jgi:hypothetical protein
MAMAVVEARKCMQAAARPEEIRSRSSEKLRTGTTLVVRQFKLGPAA